MLVRWDPFAELNRLQDDLFRGRSPLAQFDARLPVDIREEEDAFYVEAEVPGMKSEDVKVDVEKNVLTIRAERSAEEEEKRENYRRVERRYGSFSRSFTLPETIDDGAIDAHLKDAVLTLRLPKVAAPAPRTISVKH